MLGIATAPVVAQTAACGPLQNHYGPFDYTTQRSKLEIVERYHFTPEVEGLVRGKSSTSIGADINYLLKTSPNHHRGLLAAMRLGEKTKSPQPHGMEYPIECWFERAIRFRQEDTVVRVLYAQYLSKQGRRDDAVSQLDAAANLAKDNGFSHYNVGLAFFDLGLYSRALEQAHKARALGFEKEQLADLLKSKNQWKEPSS